MSARTISTSSASNISATAKSPSRPSRPASSPSARSSLRARLGDGYDFRRGQGRPRQARDLPGPIAARHSGLVLQHAPRQVQGPAHSRGARLLLRFRMDQPQHHVRPLSPHDLLFRELADDGERQALARGACDPSRPFKRQIACGRLRRGPVPPVSDGSGQDRTLLRRANDLLLSGRLQARRRQSAAARRQAVRVRIPRFRQCARAAHRALHQEPQSAWHQRALPRRRSGAI